MTKLKLFISILLITSICFLTACGGGGGSSSNSKKNTVDTNNRAIQATCIAGIVTTLRSNINNVFPSSSMRLSSEPVIRASLSDVATGEELMKLSGITGIKNDGGFIDEFNDSIEKFISRNKDNVSYKSDYMAIAANGSRHIGLAITKLGSFNIKTYFATEENSSEIVGVSYIKNTEYTTFAFKTFKDFNSLEGRVFKKDQNTLTFNENNIKDISLAEVYGDNTNFTYNDLIEETSDIFSYNGELVSNGDSKYPDSISYLVKYPETVGIRFAIKPLLDNADKILKFAPTPSTRASIDITDELKKYNTLKKTRVLIPAASIDQFKAHFNDYEMLMEKQIATDTLISNSQINMIVSQDIDSGLNVGLLNEIAELSINKQKGYIGTIVWFIADPNGKAIVCFAYCDTNNSKSSTTFTFRINTETKRVEGISFWNENIQPNGLFENFGLEEGNYMINCRNATFIGNTPEQFTYTHYNNINRAQIDGSVTIKYDGTLISTK